MSGDRLAPLWGPALFVYVLLAVGIVAFVIPRNGADASMARGALFGLVVYGVYDLDESVHATRVAGAADDGGYRVGRRGVGDHDVDRRAGPRRAALTCTSRRAMMCRAGARRLRGRKRDRKRDVVSGFSRTVIRSA